MFVYQSLLSRAQSDKPVRVGLIGAGKFGSYVLVSGANHRWPHGKRHRDLAPDRARQACRDVGWSDGQVADVRFTDDARDLTTANDVDVVVEATGNPVVGVSHARMAFAAGKHIVMVNVEADVLAGGILAREALDAGVVYSMAYGDQPALTCEMVEWARACGFQVIAAGKGTKYLPGYEHSTPDTVWDHYGLTARQWQAKRVRTRRCLTRSWTVPSLHWKWLGSKNELNICEFNATGLAAPTSGLHPFRRMPWNGAKMPPARTSAFT